MQINPHMYLKKSKTFVYAKSKIYIIF